MYRSDSIGVSAMYLHYQYQQQDTQATGDNGDNIPS